MDSNPNQKTSTWAQHLRHFLSLHDGCHLERAIAACPKPTIVTFLQWIARNMASPMPDVSALLESTANEQEGAVLLLCVYALPALSLMGEMTDEGRHAAGTCRKMIIACQRYSLPECEASLHEALGVRAAQSKDWDAAEEDLLAALDLCRVLARQAPTLYQSKLAQVLYNLGTMGCETRRYTEACAWLKESLLIWRQLPNNDDSDWKRTLSDTLAHLAIAFRETGDLDQAVLVYSEILDLDTVLAREDRRYMRVLAGTYGSRGNLFRKLRRFESARNDFESALSILPDHPSLLADRGGTLLNLGAALRELREFARAREVLLKALTIFRQIAPASADLALTLNNLGALFISLVQPTTAAKYLEEALQLWQQLSRANSSTYQVHRQDVAMTLTNLANVSLHAQKSKDARRRIVDALAAYEALIQREPSVYLVNVAACHNTLAIAFTADGDLESARAHFEAALQLRRRLVSISPEGNTQAMANTLAGLGSVYYLQGESEHAVQAWIEAISTVERLVGMTAGHLKKGSIVSAYIGLLRHFVTTGDIEAGFSILAALREGNVCALNPVNRVLARDTAEALANSARNLNTEIGILIVQTLEDGSELFGFVNSMSTELHFSRPNKEFGKIASELEKSIARAVERQGVHDPETILQLARAAWAALPDFIQDVLLPINGGVILLSGDQRWALFPWELLRFSDGADDCLGIHRVLARWSPLSATAIATLSGARAKRPQKTASILCPWNVPGSPPLEGARQEAAQVAGILVDQGYALSPAGAPLMGRTAHAQALMEILGSGPTIIHYSGHGATVDGEECLVMWEKAAPNENTAKYHAFFGKREVDEATKTQRRLSETTSLVVLNSCLTGNVRFFGGEREDLASAFLRWGAGAVVASAFPIEDSTGLKVGIAFYDSSVNRLVENVGQITQFVRALVEKSLRGGPNWCTWALLCIHGNPFVKLPSMSDSADSRDGDILRQEVSEHLRELGLSATKLEASAFVDQTTTRMELGKESRAKPKWS